MSDDINKIAEQLAEKTKNTVDSSVKNAVQESELAIKGQITKAFDEKLQASQEAINKQIAEGIAKSEEKTELATKGMADLQAELAIIKKQNKQASFSSAGLTSSFANDTSQILNFIKENKGDSLSLNSPSELATKGQVQFMGSVGRGAGFSPDFTNPTEVQKTESFNLMDFFQVETQPDINEDKNAFFESYNQFSVGKISEGQPIIINSEYKQEIKRMTPDRLYSAFEISREGVTAIQEGRVQNDYVANKYRAAQLKIARQVQSEIIFNTNASGRGMQSIIGELQKPSISGVQIPTYTTATTNVLNYEDITNAVQLPHSSLSDELVLMLPLEVFNDIFNDSSANNGQFRLDGRINIANRTITTATSIVNVMPIRPSSNVIADKGLRYKNAAGTILNESNPDVACAFLATRDSYKVVQGSRTITKDGANDMNYFMSGKSPFVFTQFFAGIVQNPEGIVAIKLKS